MVSGGGGGAVGEPPHPLHRVAAVVNATADSSRRRSRKSAGSLKGFFGEELILVLSEGRRPSDSPTRSLARRFAGALRSRGSLAAARSLTPVSHVAVGEIRSNTVPPCSISQLPARCHAGQPGVQTGQLDLRPPARPQAP